MKIVSWQFNEIFSAAWHFDLCQGALGFFLCKSFYAAAINGAKAPLALSCVSAYHRNQRRRDSGCAGFWHGCLRCIAASQCAH